MSISSIGSAPSALVTPTQPGSTEQTKGSGESSSASSASSSSSTTVTSTSATTNADGSITTTTTYADGSTTSSTSAPVAKSGPGGVGRLLDGNNAAQGNTLLAAQAQNTAGDTAGAAT